MSWDRLQMTADRPDLQFEVEIPPEMLEVMTEGGAIAPRISRAAALQVPAVLRSRNLICGTLAQLPIHIRDKERRIATPTTLLEQIDPDVANVVTFAQTYEDLLFHSIAWWRVTERGFHGYPTFAEHIAQERIMVATVAEGNRVYIDGRPVSDDQVIRFDSPNPPLLKHASRAIRTCLELDKAASRYADEPIPLGYFTPKEGSRIREDDATIQGFLDKWGEARRARAYAYIAAAVELKTMQFDAEQIQLADQRQHAVLEIARAAGVDPEDLGVSTTSRTYQNSEQRRQDLIDFTLRPYVAAVEQRLSMRDVLPRGYYSKVNFDGFLRADTKTRFEAHRIALGPEVPFETLEEVRELEDRPTMRQPRPIAPAVPETNGQAENARPLTLPRS